MVTQEYFWTAGADKQVQWAGEYKHKVRKCCHNQPRRSQRLDGNGISFIYSAATREDCRRAFYIAWWVFARKRGALVMYAIVYQKKYPRIYRTLRRKSWRQRWGIALIQRSHIKHRLHMKSYKAICKGHTLGASILSISLYMRCCKKNRTWKVSAYGHTMRFKERKQWKLYREKGKNAKRATE